MPTDHPKAATVHRLDSRGIQNRISSLWFYLALGFIAFLIVGAGPHSPF